MGAGRYNPRGPGPGSTDDDVIRVHISRDDLMGHWETFSFNFAPPNPTVPTTNPQGPAPNEPHPQSRRNPSCYEFVNGLVRWVFNPKWYSPHFEWDLGLTMMRIAIQNPFEKYMPYLKGNPSNSFQDQLTEHGQGGDVYRHILFVAGTVLAGERRARERFIAYDKKQADGGRKESIAELADDYAGIKVGELMDRAWNGKLDPDGLQSALQRELCK